MLRHVKEDVQHARKSAVSFHVTIYVASSVRFQVLRAERILPRRRALIAKRLNEFLEA